MLNRTRSYLLAGALAVMGIVIARQGWLAFELKARLDARGVVTQGTVHGFRTNKRESIALVEYALPGEGSRIREVPVSRPFAHEMRNGNGPQYVKVRYLPQDHKVADIQGASQASGWGIVIPLALFALSAWSFSRARRASQ